MKKKKGKTNQLNEKAFPKLLTGTDLQKTEDDMDMMPELHESDYSGFLRYVMT